MFILALAVPPIEFYYIITAFAIFEFIANSFRSKINFIFILFIYMEKLFWKNSFFCKLLFLFLISTELSEKNM